jgi:hypothetical protein
MKGGPGLSKLNVELFNVKIQRYLAIKLGGIHVSIQVEYFHPSHTTCTSLSFGIINSSASNATYNEKNEYITIAVTAKSSFIKK